MTEEEKKKICYEQNYIQFRSLNNTMWQVPIIAMTLTGGLWVGIQHVPDSVFFKTSILLLAATGNIGLMVVLTRIRYVMSQYLKKIEEFYPDGFVHAPGNNFFNKQYRVAGVFVALLVFSAIISLVGILQVNNLCPFKKDLIVSAEIQKQQ